VDTRERPTVTSIARALDVVQLFVEADRRDLGVTEIAKALGLSKAVVHRILSTLAERDLIAMDAASRRYRLGPMALAMGNAYLAGIDLRSLAQPLLRELSAETNETATLSIRHGWQRVYIDQALPDRDIKMTVSLGQAFPLHAGSSSKAFLAFLPAEMRDRYLAESGLAPITGSTPTDAAALRAELAAIAERGYAVSFGERQEGAGSVAAPILDHLGQPVAAVSVCGPIERFRGEVDAMVGSLLTVAGELTRLLGGTPQPATHEPRRPPSRPRRLTQGGRASSSGSG